MASYTTVVIGDDATAELLLDKGQAPMLAIRDGDSQVVISLAAMSRDEARDVVREISRQAERWSSAIDSAAVDAERRTRKRAGVVPVSVVPEVPGVAS